MYQKKRFPSETCMIPGCGIYSVFISLNLDILAKHICNNTKTYDKIQTTYK